MIITNFNLNNVVINFRIDEMKNIKDFLFE